MSIMAKTPSGYKKIGSAYLGERPVDKVYNANGDVVYALQRELTGVPPLLFKGKEQSELLNYRIYGGTVDGNGVGDLVESGEHAGEYEVSVTVEGKNLLDETHNTIPRAILEGGAITAGDGYLIYAPINPLQTYTFRTNGTIRLNLRSAFTINEPAVPGGYVIDGVNTHINHGANKEFTRQAPLNANWIVIQIRDESALAYDNMLVEGSTPLPFEPYHEPITTPIYLPEPIKMVGDEAEYVDYKEQKQHRVRKNLLPNTATSQTINGVTFTVNEDGSITCNGTPTNITEFMVILDFLLPPGNYRLTGCPPGGWPSYPGGKVSYCLRAWYAISGNITWIFEYGDGCNFTLTDTKKMRSSIVIEKAQVVDNITFYPMIRKADIEDDTYEPYIEDTDLDVTLPALPTLTGTNVMSVGTEVQPSRMDIEGRIKSLT